MVGVVFEDDFNPVHAQRLIRLKVLICDSGLILLLLLLNSTHAKVILLILMTNFFVEVSLHT